jgi:RNA polymerase sigma factor (sigma-70 family)
MANGRLDGVLQHIRKLVAAEGGGAVSDQQLLERFVRRRDEEAFAALVQRHGPMVLAVCRRVLGNPHDAEDACQAAFLILARKAASIRKQASVGSWLHGVAYRAAANLKRAIARRRRREAPVVDVPQAEPAEVSWREVRAVLDEELQRLPERFRAPLLLCCLEGKTRDEAAQELGWSVGAVRGRLERGRELLRARLTRRGVTLSAALLAALLTEKAVTAALPAGLVVTIVKAVLPSAAGRTAAQGVVSARVVALTEGVLRAMLMTRLKFVAAVLFVVGLAGVGIGVLTSGVLTAQPPDDPTAAPGAAPEQDGRAADPPPAGGDKQEQPADAAELARNAAQSRGNLKQIVLGMHNYNDTMGHLPAPAIYAGERYPGSGGRPASQPGGPGGWPPGGPPGGSGPGMAPSSAGGPPTGKPGAGGPPAGPGPGGPPGMGQPTGPGGPGGSMPPGGSMGTGSPTGTGPRSALAGDGPPLPGTGRRSALTGDGPALPGSGGPPGAGQPGAPGGTPPPGPSVPGGLPGGSTPPGPGTPGMPGTGTAPGQGGKALLSWRVTLLPYLGEDNLYKQFKLDEPWDGPHNKKLLEKMPKVYAAPGVKTREPYTTFYQVFVGADAPFQKHQLARIPASFPDGTSNTILIAEAGNAVPWTKPEDLHFALDEPLPELGGVYPGIINVAFADGSAAALSARADPDMLRGLITPNGGEVVDIDKLRAPTSPREAQLRKRNEKLKQELEQQRDVLEELRREKQQLQQEDAGTEQLKRENARLEELLQKTRDEAEQLRQEIQRLRKAPEKPPGQSGP